MVLLKSLRNRWEGCYYFNNDLKYMVEFQGWQNQRLWQVLHGRSACTKGDLEEQDVGEGRFSAKSDG